MDPIYEVYKNTIKPADKQEMLSEYTIVPMEKMPKDKKEWENNVEKLINTLNRRFSVLTFTANKIEWDAGNFKGKDFKAAKFVIDISVYVAKNEYIDSIPYVNLTKKFYSELKDVVSNVSGIAVNDISFNNNGSTFWGLLRNE